MNPGDLKQRLIFTKPSGGVNENGFPIKEPSEYSKARGALKTLRGNTFYTAAQNNMEHNREFTIRYNKKLTDEVRPKGMQLIWKGATHEIVSIENDDGLNVSMTVIARLIS